MKKLIMIILLAGTVMCAEAQTKKGAGKVPKALIAKLNLTADQQTKVEAIYASKAAKIDSLTATGAVADDKATKKKKRAINTEADVQLQAVLTDDQKKIYSDFKDAQKEKAKAKMAAAESVAAPKTTPPAQ